MVDLTLKLHRLLLFILSGSLRWYLVSYLLLLLAWQVLLSLQPVLQLLDLFLRLKMISVRICQLATSLFCFRCLWILSHVVRIVYLWLPFWFSALCLQCSAFAARILLLHLRRCSLDNLFLLLSLCLLGAFVVCDGTALVVKRGNLARVTNGWAYRTEFGLSECGLWIQFRGFGHDVAQRGLGDLNLDIGIIENRSWGETHGQTN